MVAKQVSVKVVGLSDLRRELKKLDDSDEFNAELKEVNFEIADTVVGRAKVFASTKLQRRAAQSLKAGRGASRATISGGGAQTPFFGGAEFGSIQYTQFEPWRGNDRSAGYFLYPTIRNSTDEIVEMYGDALEKITARAFPD